MSVSPAIEDVGRAYIDQLSALRGVACLFVLLGHVIQVFNYQETVDSGVIGWISLIIRGLFNAEGAVLLFFVLSGCVLAMSLQCAGQLEARMAAGFYIKRVFRLYPMLWLSTFVALAGVMAVRPILGEAVFAAWLQMNVQEPVTPAHILLSMAGIWTKYDGPMWSLRVELIYSALFPLIYLLVSKPSCRFWIILALAGLALLPVAHPQYGTAFGISFGLGALIPFLPRPAAKLHASVVLLALIILCYDRVFLSAYRPPDIVYDFIETIASFVIVLDIYAGRRRYSLLSYRPMIRVGDLSFSIYLLHLPILLMIFVVLQHFAGLAPLLDHPSLTQFGLGTLTAAASVSLARLTFTYIEAPLNRFGRRMAARIGTGRRGDEMAVIGVPTEALPLA